MTMKYNSRSMKKGKKHEYETKIDEIEKKSEVINACLKELLDISSFEDEEVRMRAMEAMKDIRTPEIEERILSGLDDPGELVRHSCLEILGLWKDKLAIEKIRKCLDDQSWLVRSEAALTLAEIEDLESISLIKKNCGTGSNDEEKIRYYFALLKLGETGYFCRFLNGLFHDNYRVRCATVNLIPGIVTIENEGFLLNLLSAAAKSEKTAAALSSIKDVINELSNK